VEHIADVTVHIDPEDDETASPSNRLPLRDEVMQRLQQQWDGLLPDDCLERVMLHYLDGRIHVDVFLAPACGEAQARDLAGPLRAAAAEVEDIGTVRIYLPGQDAPE